MKLSKTISISVLALILCFFSAGCNTTSAGGAAISTSVEDIAVLIEAKLPLTDGYYSPTDNYFNYYFKGLDGQSLSKLEDISWIIRRSNSQDSENEFGIIRSSYADVKQVETSCNAYIERQRNAYLEAKASYSPKEYEKYRDASVHTVGNTVIYFILSSDDTKIARSIIEDALKQ